MTDVVLRLPDPTVGVRFFVGYQKGLNKIYSFVHGLAGWEVAKKPITFTHESLVNPLASFVIDAENGEELKPNAPRLQGQSPFPPPEKVKQRTKQPCPRFQLP